MTNHSHGTRQVISTLACWLIAHAACHDPALARDTLLPVLRFARLSGEDGLPSNHIRSRIVRDDQGYVWIGTVNGLARYDGYTFRVYRAVPGEIHSYASNGTNAILQDRRNRLWFGGWQQGLSLYDRPHDRFLNFARSNAGDKGYRPAPVKAIFEDHSGAIWLGTEGGGVVHLTFPEHQANPESLAARARFTTYTLGTPGNSAADLYQRSDGTILVASDQGVLLIDPSGRAVLRPAPTDPLAHCLTSSVERILEDSRGNIWIATATDGLFRIAADASVQNFRHRRGDPAALRSDVVWDIAQAPEGQLWVGTEQGIDILSPVTGISQPYIPLEPFPGVSFLTRISFDQDGIAWIGTASDGVYQLNPKSLSIPCYSIPARKGAPRAFHHIECAEDGTLWLTSEGVLLHLDPDTRRILRTIDVFGGRQESFPYRSNYQAYLQGSSVLWWGTTGLGLYRVDLTTGSARNFYSQSRVGRGGIALSVVPAGDDRSLWIAGHNDGLLKFDVRSGEFRRIPSKAWSAYTHIMKDRAGLLWLATETAGVLTYDPATASEVVYAHDPTDSTSLSHSWARATLQDSEGRIWVGAGNVVNLVDSIRGTFTRYSNAKHADAIFNSPVGMDNFGRLWTSFSTGVLAVLEPTTGAFTNLGPADGICGYVTDMEVLSDGRVVLAGESGLNLFDPRAISLKRMPPPLRITRLTINDGAVPPVDLDGAAGALQLTYEQNVIEIEFAALDMQAPGSIDYRYQLVGLEPDWVRLQNRRYVRYSGLPPGDYRFSVVASPGRDEWPEQEVALDILIAPPWWRTPWAYILYALFTLGFMYGAYLTWLGRFRLKQQAAMEHFQAARLADVDRLKSRFFANISHEFRTPLTLILGPIRKWRERTGIDAEARDLETAERNARRLLGLVNQLLDLSKIEAQAMRVRARLMNVVPLIRGVANSFESTADLKGISLDVRADRDAIVAYIDPDMLEKILTNLISNAFKFTQTGGRVAVEAAVVSGDGVVVSTPAEEEGFLEILVSDTGIGISPEDIPRLFDRFYQVDSSQARAYEGTGIGLALVKELVDLHHGSVGVKSRAGHGSEFRVRLPLGRRHLKDEEITASEAPVATPHAERGDAGIALVPADSARTDGIGQSAGVSGVADEAGPVEGKPVVLVVEDNVDVRVYIKEQLVASYNVLEAEDGAKGVERALEAVPDLIISDIMMPGMDGYRLCRILKEDEKTSHIPIILLTAKAGTEHRIEGLETGADDYLIKPFEPKELVARVRNLIEVRRKLRARFNVPLRPGDIVVASMDDAFLKKAVEAVERHMGEEAFGVTELGEALAMSRVQLHRKITALTDRPPGEFIRYLRLHRAMELLKRDAGTVSEIAYSVGFSDPSHFTRRFRELFGTLPSDVRKNPSDQT